MVGLLHAPQEQVGRGLHARALAGRRVGGGHPQAVGAQRRGPRLRLRAPPLRGVAVRRRQVDEAARHVHEQAARLHGGPAAEELGGPGHVGEGERVVADRVLGRVRQHRRGAHRGADGVGPGHLRHRVADHGHRPPPEQGGAGELDARVEHVEHPDGLHQRLVRVVLAVVEQRRPVPGQPPLHARRHPVAGGARRHPLQVDGHAGHVGVLEARRARAVHLRAGRHPGGGGEAERLELRIGVPRGEMQRGVRPLRLGVADAAALVDRVDDVAAGQLVAGPVPGDVGGGPGRVLIDRGGVARVDRGEPVLDPGDVPYRGRRRGRRGRRVG